MSLTPLRNFSAAPGGVAQESEKVRDCQCMPLALSKPSAEQSKIGVTEIGDEIWFNRWIYQSRKIDVVGEDK